MSSRSEPGSAAAVPNTGGGPGNESGDWGPRDWCASGVGGESFDLAPAAGMPLGAGGRRAGRGSRHFASVVGGAVAEVEAGGSSGSSRRGRRGRSVGQGEPTGGTAGGERPDWVVDAEEEPGGGERPDWVVDAEEEPLPSAAPDAATRRAPGARRRSRRGTVGERGAPEPRAARQDGAGRPPEPDPASRARDICLRLLTGNARTRKQLADALRKREIPDEVAEEVLSRFEEVGLIDDAAFAAAWVESRHAGRGLARRALAQELRTRGVAGAVVEEAVAQLDPEDETAAARALVERKLRSTAGLERQARMRRLVGMLARRGYPEGLAFRVVREVLDAEGENGEELEDWSLGDV